MEFDASTPNTAILRYARDRDRKVLLYYAAGAVPYVNIVDDNDMPVPAFGPVALNE